MTLHDFQYLAEGPGKTGLDLRLQDHAVDLGVNENGIPVIADFSVTTNYSLGRVNDDVVVETLSGDCLGSLQEQVFFWIQGYGYFPLPL